MSLISAGVSHHAAALDVRERLTLQRPEVTALLERLRATGAIREGVIISTCNRTELYAMEGESDAVSALWESMSDRLGSEVSGYGCVRRDREAAAHVFRVASGLDSMILGEAQIQGQVRDAWEACRPHAGAALHRLFQSALGVAGRVRSETGIARGAASVSSAAVQLAKQIFGTLNGVKAMVLGAGEMAELALACLAEEGARVAVVANRTYDRAVEIAARHGALAMRFDECWEQLPAMDLLLCSTASPRPVVTLERVRAAVAARGDRPLCILDIAVPRDVEHESGALANVFLYDLDDFQRVVSANIDRRRAEVPGAERLIAAEVERYWNWLAGLEAVPVLTEFRERMDVLRRAELAAAKRRLNGLSPEEQESVERLTRSLMNKFMHEPSVRLRLAAANGRGLGVVDAMRYLFGLNRAQASDTGAVTDAPPARMHPASSSDVEDHDLPWGE
jgi:glutamyl-tRNA reductase